jgi:hypothetical protein
MTSVLKNILRYTNLQVGVPVSLPHLLNVETTPVQPQFIDGGAPGFTMAADTVNLTVTRTAAANSGNVDVFVEYWHSIERVLPQPGNLAGLVPFVAGDGGAPADATPTLAFVFRPGGVAGGNVYTTWPSLMAAVGPVQGPKVIQFDDTIISPVVVPAGTYDMMQTAWAGILNHQTVVNVSEGAVFPRLRRFTNNILVQFTGSTPPVSDFSFSFDTVFFDVGASMTCIGTGPFFRVAAPVNIVVVQLTGTKLVTGTSPILDLSVPGAASFVGLTGGFVDFTTNVVSGVVGSFLGLIIAESGPTTYSYVQPAFLGSFANVNFARGRLYSFPPPPSAPLTNNTIVGDANQTVRCDPSGGAFSVTLPSVAFFMGQEIIIKNVSASANVITILPAVGDTVDGAASQTIASAHGFMRFVSDGGTTWLRVA